MKVDTNGALRHLLNFGSLRNGETFMSDNKVHLKFEAAGFDLETGHTLVFDENDSVHKVNFIALPIKDKQDRKE